MDEQSLKTARMQYKRLFDVSDPHYSARSLPAHKSPDEKFSEVLTTSTLGLLQYKLGYEEFDEITVNPEDSGSYHPEDYFHLLTQKFQKLIEILQSVDLELVELEKQNHSLREVLANKMRISEKSVEDLKTELELALNENIELCTAKDQQEDVENHQDLEIQVKEDTIHQLNQSIKAEMDEFIAKREYYSQLEAAVNKYAEDIMQLRSEHEDIDMKKEQN